MNLCNHVEIFTFHYFISISNLKLEYLVYKITVQQTDKKWVIGSPNTSQISKNRCIYKSTLFSNFMNKPTFVISDLMQLECYR